MDQIERGKAAPLPADYTVDVAARINSSTGELERIPFSLDRIRTS